MERFLKKRERSQPPAGVRVYRVPKKMKIALHDAEAEQLEFAQRYIYGGRYRTENWDSYKKRKGI